jgi:hypothetical protein
MVVAMVPVVEVAVLAVATLPLPTVATSPLVLALAQIPLSANAEPRPLQQRTVKENNYAATRTPQVP